MDLDVDYTSPTAPQDFARALRDTGFAVLRGHQVPWDLIASTYEEWARFFASAEKTKYLYDETCTWGYYPLLAENAKGREVKDLKEFFHVYAWSPIPVELGGGTRRLFDLLSGLAAILLGWLDDATTPEARASLSMPLRTMIEGSSNTVLRIIHYPPLRGDEPQGALRSSPHEDINLLTLLPAGTAPGLELRDSAGAWRAVATDPSAIVVNAGDMLQMATSGFYRSTSHRVVNPSGADARRSRYSMPLFLHPRPEVRLMASRTAGDYLNERLAEIGLKEGKSPQG